MKRDIRLHQVTITLAQQGGPDPSSWDWDALIGDPPLGEDTGTLVLSVRSEEIMENALGSFEATHLNDVLTSLDGDA